MRSESTSHFPERGVPMSLKLSLTVITLVWLGYVAFASTFYMHTFSLFN